MGLDAAFLAVVADHTAGDPMRAEVRWTNLGLAALARRLAVGRWAVRRPLRRHGFRRHGFRRRRATKDRRMGDRPGRDEQFRRIAALKAEYLAAGDPVVSIDTKKRELVGNFARPGTVLAGGPVRTFDHGPERSRRARRSPRAW